MSEILGESHIGYKSIAIGFDGRRLFFGVVTSAKTKHITSMTPSILIFKVQVMGVSTASKMTEIEVETFDDRSKALPVVVKFSMELWNELCKLQKRSGERPETVDIIADKIYRWRGDAWVDLVGGNKV